MASKTLESKRTATAVDMPSADAPIHPAADIFPVLSDADFAELRHDIELHGVLEPIWVDREGRVLDGRHRLRAAHELEMTCQTFVYDGPNPIGFVLSHNLHRRHLTTSQRAMVAAKMATLREGRPSKDTPQKCGVSTKQAAEKLRVSTRTVENAKTVLQHGSQNIVHAVETGELRVGRAALLATAAIAEPQTIEGSSIETAETIATRKVEKAQMSAAAPVRLRALRNDIVRALERIRCQVPWKDRKGFLEEVSDYNCEALALTRATWNRRLGDDFAAAAAPAEQHNRDRTRSRPPAPGLRAGSARFRTPKASGSRTSA
jgi:hypothetical protein